MKCPTCKVINLICFWGDQPEKKWKRPTLLLLSIVLLLSGSYFSLVSEHPSSQNPLIFFLASILAIFCLLGVFVSLVGCDRCVARILGNF